MKQSKLDELVQKSQSKKDGVHKCGSLYYVAKNKELKLIGDCVSGDILQYLLGLVKIGNTPGHKVRKCLEDLSTKICW